MYERDNKALVDENLSLKNTVKSMEARIFDLNCKVQDMRLPAAPSSMDEPSIPEIVMVNLARDFATFRAEIGHSQFRKDSELSKLRDDVSLLRSTCQTLQFQLFNLSLKKGPSSSPKTTTSASTKL